MRAGPPRLILTRRFAAVAVAAAALLVPANALALRYAGPTGSSSADCQTPATACDLRTAVAGDGISNFPSSGEEVIVEPGSYSVSSASITPGATNLDIHGATGQPRPVISLSQVWFMSNGTLSDLRLNVSTGGQLNMSGGLLERMLMDGSTGSGQALCQCYGGVQRNSVFVAHGSASALGVSSNGGTSTSTYRNDTAISTDVTWPAIDISHSSGGSVTADAYNVIARNLAGGPDVRAGSTAATLTLRHSNYASPVELGSGVVTDAPGDAHQTAVPLFTNAATDDFSELPGSPTIDAGLSDPANGTLDFAGDARAIGGSTDIGAYEYVPPSPPTFTLGAAKVKINRKGRGSLPFSCGGPASDHCSVNGALTAAGKAKQSGIGQVSGTVQAGTSGALLVRLSKAGRKRLAAKRKLRATLAGTVSNGAGLGSALSASLLLTLKG